MWIKKLFFILLFLFLCSCDKVEGQFAYKSMEMDMYRKFPSGMEFNAAEKINWIFNIKKVSAERKVGVVLLKKELTWIDIDKYMYTVNMFQTKVYGEFVNLPAGEYKIVLLNNNFLISSVEFKIYEE